MTVSNARKTYLPVNRFITNSPSRTVPNPWNNDFGTRSMKTPYGWSIFRSNRVMTLTPGDIEYMNIHALTPSVFVATRYGWDRIVSKSVSESAFIIRHFVVPTNPNVFRDVPGNVIGSVSRTHC